MWPVAVDGLKEVINGRWHKARQVDPRILLRAIQGLLLNGLRLSRMVLWKWGNKQVPVISSGVTGSASGGLLVSPRLGRGSCSVVIVVMADVGSCGSSRHGSVAGGGLGELAGWVGTCSLRWEEGSQSQAVDPIAGRNWKHVALVLALPKTSTTRALLSFDETGAFEVARSAFRLASCIASAIAALLRCSCLSSALGWSKCLCFLGVVPHGDWLSRRICTGRLACCCANSITMGNSADDDVIIVVDDSSGFRRSCQCPAILPLYHII
jgi:hypothetical protein